MSGRLNAILLSDEELQALCKYFDYTECVHGSYITEIMDKGKELQSAIDKHREVKRNAEEPLYRRE